MKKIKILLIISVMFSLFLQEGGCESIDNMTYEWNNWRINSLGYDDEHEWDGNTYEMSVPEDPDFWWKDLYKNNNNIYTFAYTCNSSSIYYSVIDGVLFSADLKTLFKYPPMKKGWYYLIPSTVECIEAEAFADNFFLQEVVVCDSVKIIREDAFNRSRITRLHVPASVIDFDFESISQAICLKDIIVKEGSECWQSLKIAEDSQYSDFIERGIVKVY